MELEMESFDVRQCVAEAVRLATPAAVPHPVLSGKRVLVVDPDMEDFRLVEKLRTVPRRAKLPLSVLSPLGDPAASCGHARVEVCLSKPVLRSRLHAAMGCVFGVEPSSQGRKEASPLAVSASETAARHPLHILLAEDNFVNQRVAVGLLSKLGYRADVVADGNEAVDAVLRIPYDLVLMDIQMPELDGEQAALRIRKEVPAEHQPWIVAMTANVMKGDRERYLSHGMNDYISKPIRVEALVEVLLLVPPRASRETRAKPV